MKGLGHRGTPVILRLSLRARGRIPRAVRHLRWIGRDRVVVATFDGIVTAAGPHGKDSEGG